MSAHRDALSREDAPSRNLATAEPWWRPRHAAGPEIVRVDRYTITIGETRVRADVDAERRLRAMRSDELVRFRAIMGG